MEVIMVPADMMFWDAPIREAERALRSLKHAADYAHNVEDAIKYAQKFERGEEYQDRLADMTEKMEGLSQELKQRIDNLAALLERMWELRSDAILGEHESLFQEIEIRPDAQCVADEWMQLFDEMETEVVVHFAIALGNRKNKAWKRPCRPAEILGCAPRTKTDSIHLRAARRSKRLPRSDMTGAAPELKTKEE